MLAWSLVGLVVLAVAAVAAVGWVLSSRVIVPSPYGLMPEFELTAVAELGAGVTPSGSRRRSCRGTPPVTMPVTPRRMARRDPRSTPTRGSKAPTPSCGKAATPRWARRSPTRVES